MVLVSASLQLCGVDTTPIILVIVIGGQWDAHSRTVERTFDNWLEGVRAGILVERIQVAIHLFPDAIDTYFANVLFQCSAQLI